MGKPDDEFLKEFEEKNEGFILFLRDDDMFKKSSLENVLNKGKCYKRKDIKEVCDLSRNMINWDYKSGFSTDNV